MYVVVVEYDGNWPGLYRVEAEKIRKILGDNLVEIHHIGSTAVPNLVAKPIIDILPVVQNIARVDACNAAFEAIGYECMGEFGIPGRRYFRKGGDNRTHQVHIFEWDNQTDIRRHLAVRDYLRAHRQAAAEYGQLKLRLAQKFPEDIEGYCDGKDNYVKQLEQQALSWFEKSHT